jgi:GntR family transcriptional regulator
MTVLYNPTLKLSKMEAGKVPVPLYHQVRTGVENFLRSGQLKPGDVIPAEQYLCSQFGVSRGTVRMAIGELVKEGLLRREQGKGTFIASPRFEKSLLGYFRFTQKDSSEDIVPESRIIEITKADPPVAISKALGLSLRERVFKIKRIRTVNGNPFIYQVSVFPEKLFPGLQEIDCNAPSLYTFITERYGIHITEVEEYLTADLPDYETQRLLGLKRESPIIVIERKAFSFNERAIEVRRSVGRADRYHYRIRL